MLVQVASFLNEDECNSLCRTYDRVHTAARQHDYNGQPVIDWGLIQSDSQISALCRFIVQRVASLVETIQQENLHPETAVLAAMGPGHSFPLHADNCRNEEDEWVPNHTPNRLFSTILYLNDGYGGGEIVFPSQQQRIKPSTGLLVGFPSGRAYVHEVATVTHGRRYSMPIWFAREGKALIR